ncbi:MAG: hypothetical protein ABMB14_18285 [Myxococcota bacterium]
MRWILYGGATMLLALACGAPDSPPSAPVPTAAPAPAAPAPAAPRAPPTKRGKRGSSDCDAYCEKFERCAHTEGWDYDEAECGRSCRAFADRPHGESIVPCFLNTDVCADAIGCVTGAD